MARRAAGEGSIYPVRRRGKIVGYAASLSLGYTPDGKRDRKKIERKTRREVAEELAILQHKRGSGIDLSAKTTSVRNFLAYWMNDIYTPTVRASSATKHQWAFEKIDPFIGSMLVSKVSSVRIQQLVTELRKTNLSESSIAQIIAHLKHALNHAIDPLHWINKNPCDGIKLPHAKAKPPVFLSPDQANVLLGASRGHRLEAAVRLMLSLGLRRGEVCALRWEDTDFEKHRITINATLQRVKGYGKVRNDPKTENGWRILPLPAVLSAALVWHRTQQEQTRKLLGYGPSEYVFTMVEKDGALNPSQLYDAIKTIIKPTNLPQDLTPHDLRHSCASFLIAQNVHPKVISSILGHANIRITMDLYGHLFDAQLDDAANKVDTMLGESKPHTKSQSKSS